MSEEVVTDAFGRVARGSAFIFVGTVVGMGAGLATRLVVARHLPPAKYGLVVLGLTALHVLALISLLGLSKGIAREIPRTDDPTTPFRTSLLVAVPLAAVFAIGIALFSDAIAAFFGKPGFAPVLTLFGVGLPFYVLIDLISGYFRGEEDAKSRVFVTNFGFQGLVLVFVAVGTVLDFGVVGIVSAWVGAIVCASAFGLVVLARRASLLEFDALVSRPNWGDARVLVGFSLSLVLIDAVSILLGYSDNVFIGYFLSGESLGIYDAAYTVSKALKTVGSMFEFLFLPVFSALHANGDEGAMNRLYTITTKWMIVLSLPVYLFVVFFPEFVLRVGFGPAYVSEGLLLAIVSTSAFVAILVGLTQYALIAIGRTKLLLRASVLALFVNVALNFLLVPTVGIVGAAVATLASQAFVNVYTLYILRSLTGIAPFSRSVLRPTLGCGVFLVVVFTLVKLAFTIRLRSALALVAGVAVVYPLAVLAFGGIRREEWSLLMELDDRLPVDVTVLRRFLAE